MQLTKEEVINKMKERGYSFVSESRNGNNEPVELHFINDDTKQRDGRFIIPAFSVSVNLPDSTFSFLYNSGTSLNKLVTPSCGSFMDDKHFERIEIKFAHDASVLHKFGM